MLNESISVLSLCTVLYHLLYWQNMPTSYSMSSWASIDRCEFSCKKAFLMLCAILTMPQFLTNPKLRTPYQSTNRSFQFVCNFTYFSLRQIFAINFLFSYCSVVVYVLLSFNSSFYSPFVICFLFYHFSCCQLCQCIVNSCDICVLLTDDKNLEI